MFVFDPADPAVKADPFPAFARLRAEDPIHWSPALKAWVATRYEDVRSVTLDNVNLSADRLAPFFRSAAGERAAAFPNLRLYLSGWLVFRDPPRHTRLRRLLASAFTPVAVEAMRPAIERTVDDLLDAMAAKAARGEVVDWIADFAYPLPATVTMDLMGVPRADIDRVKMWSDAIALFIGSAQVSPDKYARAEEGVRAMADFFRQLVAERAAEPRGDLISALVAARDERDALTPDETIATCILILFAGHETTTNMLGNGFHHSLALGGPWEELRADPSLAGRALEEWLRYDGPTAGLARVVARDFEMGGKSLRQGDRLFAFLNSANRDEERFPEADRFDVRRDPNPHLAFGNGIHFCLGAPLARLEGRIALGRVAERFPGIALAGGVPEWSDSLVLRGIRSIPVRIP